jgi:anti-sigma-K factor RskA
MKAHDEMLDNVAVYALGALPPDEARAVEAHLRTCAECRQEYDALRPAVTAMASSAEVNDATCPGPLLKARIMREVRRTAAVPVAPQRSQMWIAVAAAMIFAAGGVFSGAAIMNGRMHHQAAIIAAQSQTMGDLAAGKRYGFGDGAVIVRGTHLYVTMPKMHVPPKGMVYQAWTLPKGSKKMAPSVTFMPNGDETVIRLPESAGGIAAVAVSVEPAGGSLQPTSKPIAVAVL